MQSDNNEKMLVFSLCHDRINYAKILLLEMTMRKKMREMGKAKRTIDGDVYLTLRRKAYNSFLRRKGLARQGRNFEFRPTYQKCPIFPQHRPGLCIPCINH